jgi:ADP-heptose:LPS heptosyltransferase
MIRPFRLLDRYLALRRQWVRREGSPRGVLLVAAGGLGDTVLFAHVLPRFLRLARPGEAVTVLLRRDAARMAFLFPPGIGVLAVDFARFQRGLVYRREIMTALYQANYRLAVSVDYLRHPFLDEAMIEAAAAAETLAMTPKPWRKYARALTRNHRLYTRLHDSGPPLTDKIARWTKFANWLLGSDDPPPLARLPDDRLPPPANVQAPTVVMQPFSAVPRKQPRPELWRKIIESLPADHRVVVAGAPTDLDANPEYLALLKLPNVTFDGSTFQDLVPLLRAARLVVSVDTALMHLAIAVGARTFGLASAAYVGEIVPYDAATAPANAHFIYHPMPCQGCLGDCILPAEAGMYPCVARLDEDKILAELRGLLGST